MHAGRTDSTMAFDCLHSMDILSPGLDGIIPLFPAISTIRASNLISRSNIVTLDVLVKTGVYI